MKFYASYRSAVSAVKKQPKQPSFLFSAVSDSRDSRAFYFPLFFLLADSRIFIQRLKKTAVPNGLLAAENSL